MIEALSDALVQQNQQPHDIPQQYPSHDIPQYQQQFPQLSQLPQQPADSRGFYYPYPYQNVNWYNWPYLWPAVATGAVAPTQPGGGCPTGLCPAGASCLQNAGQWQCQCGAGQIGGCVGIQNPCGTFGRYYFPYYPDASRFIQCDQTGVFWIRKCAPGTIFDPKISVCNYPPVVVETGRK